MTCFNVFGFLWAKPPSSQYLYILSSSSLVSNVWGLIDKIKFKSFSWTSGDLLEKCISWQFIGSDHAIVDILTALQSKRTWFDEDDACEDVDEDEAVSIISSFFSSVTIWIRPPFTSKYSPSSSKKECLAAGRSINGSWIITSSSTLDDAVVAISLARSLTCLETPCEKYLVSSATTECINTKRTWLAFAVTFVLQLVSFLGDGIWILKFNNDSPLLVLSNKDGGVDEVARSLFSNAFLERIPVAVPSLPIGGGKELVSVPCHVDKSCIDKSCVEPWRCIPLFCWILTFVWIPESVSNNKCRASLSLLRWTDRVRRVIAIVVLVESLLVLVRIVVGVVVAAVVVELMSDVVVAWFELVALFEEWPSCVLPLRERSALLINVAISVIDWLFQLISKSVNSTVALVVTSWLLVSGILWWIIVALIKGSSDGQTNNRDNADFCWFLYIPRFSKIVRSSTTISVVVVVLSLPFNIDVTVIFDTCISITSFGIVADVPTTITKSGTVILHWKISRWSIVVSSKLGDGDDGDDVDVVVVVAFPRFVQFCFLCIFWFLIKECDAACFCVSVLSSSIHASRTESTVINSFWLSSNLTGGIFVMNVTDGSDDVVVFIESDTVENKPYISRGARIPSFFDWVSLFFVSRWCFPICSTFPPSVSICKPCKRTSYWSYIPSLQCVPKIFVFTSNRPRFINRDWPCSSVAEIGNKRVGAIISISISNGTLELLEEFIAVVIVVVVFISLPFSFVRCGSCGCNAFSILPDVWCRRNAILFPIASSPMYFSIPFEINVIYLVNLRTNGSTTLIRNAPVRIRKDCFVV